MEWKQNGRVDYKSSGFRRFVCFIFERVKQIEHFVGHNRMNMTNDSCVYWFSIKTHVSVFFSFNLKQKIKLIVSFFSVVENHAIESDAHTKNDGRLREKWQWNDIAPSEICVRWALFFSSGFFWFASKINEAKRWEECVVFFCGMYCSDFWDIIDWHQRNVIT